MSEQETLGLRDVQADLKTWHGEKYPRALLSDLGLKLAEESGEVCRALDRIHYAKSDAATKEWLVNLTEEIGDVAIVLMVLCNRGFLDFEEIVRLRAAEVMER